MMDEDAINLNGSDSLQNHILHCSGFVGGGANPRELTCCPVRD